MKKKMVYISLPIGEIEEKIEKQRKFASRVEEQLLKAGYWPVNPFNNDLPEDATREKLLKNGFHLLTECDVIMLCPGWVLSDGCSKEYTLARWSGIEIMSDSEMRTIVDGINLNKT